MEKEKKMAQLSAEKCPECKGINLITDYDTGETVCGNCGLVLIEQIQDTGPEWRAFTQEEKESRAHAGAPTTYARSDKGLSTYIHLDRDASGKALSLKTFSLMKRLKKQQNRERFRSSSDRSLIVGIQEMDRLCDKISISRDSSIKETAVIIFREILRKRLIRGKKIIALIPACLYIACRKTNTFRTLQEISNASLVDKKTIASSVRFLIKKLDFRLLIINPVQRVSKIAEKIGISGKTQGKAIKIIHQAEEKRYGAGKDPMSLAAAALYIACLLNNEKQTQGDIAREAEITEVTVRNRYKDLVKILDIKIPTESEKIRSFFIAEACFLP